MTRDDTVLPIESTRGPRGGVQGSAALAASPDDPPRDQGGASPQHVLAREAPFGVVQDGPARHRLPARRAGSADRVRPRRERLPLLPLRLRPALPARRRERSLLDRRRGAGLRALRGDARRERPESLLRAASAADAGGRGASPPDRHGEARAAGALPPRPRRDVAGRLGSDAAWRGSLDPLSPAGRTPGRPPHRS